MLVGWLAYFFRHHTLQKKKIEGRHVGRSLGRSKIERFNIHNFERNLSFLGAVLDTPHALPPRPPQVYLYSISSTQIH